MDLEARSNGSVARILNSHQRLPSEIIPILQEVQSELGYVPGDAMSAIARFVRVPESAIYGVATFYAQFYLAPQGKHRIRVCQGTACHVRGGKRILQEVRKSLQIKPGETTPDYEFSLERVACLGSCALAPVMVVDQKVHGAMTAAKAKEQLERIRRTSQSEPKTD